MSRAAEACQLDRWPALQQQSSWGSPEGRVQGWGRTLCSAARACFCAPPCPIVFTAGLLSAPPLSQDFEAITPNLLARTIETVEGGGVVVMLLRRGRTECPGARRLRMASMRLPT